MGQIIVQGFDVIRFIVTNIRKHVFLLISYQKPGHPHEQLVDDDALVNNGLQGLVVSKHRGNVFKTRDTITISDLILI